MKNARLPLGGALHQGSQTPSTDLRHPSSNEPLVIYAIGLPTQSAKRQDLLLLLLVVVVVVGWLVFPLVLKQQ